MNVKRHFSVFEIDAWFASSGPVRDTPEAREIEQHLARCAVCRRHVDAMDADAIPLAPPRARGRLLRLVPVATTALALAAGVFLYVRGRGVADEASYVGEKGAPAAQVLVRRDGAVHLWDGTSPVRAGDALAVRASCEEFSQLAIASEDASPVWQGPCPARGGSKESDPTLPFTLVVDDQPGAERFVVVFSRDRLDGARLEAAVRGSTRSDEAWTLAFEFAKEAGKPE